VYERDESQVMAFSQLWPVREWRQKEPRSATRECERKKAAERKGRRNEEARGLWPILEI